MSGPALTFRDARPGDEAAIARAVLGIADAEGLRHKVLAGPDDYARLLFAPEAALYGVIAEAGGALVGCVLWHKIVFTYSGRLGVYIEDVYVEPDHRGFGVGRALFAEMARRATSGGYDRLQWSCKNDNLAAIGFYQRLGAESVDGFTTHRLSGAALAAMATPSPSR